MFMVISFQFQEYCKVEKFAAKATFEAAKSTGRGVINKFDGRPSQEIINKLNQYSGEYGVKVIIKY
jgi:filamentous hemagglutinin